MKNACSSKNIKKKFVKQQLKKVAAVSSRSADDKKNYLVTHKHKTNVTLKLYNNINNIRNNDKINTVTAKDYSKVNNFVITRQISVLYAHAFGIQQ